MLTSWPTAGIWLQESLNFQPRHLEATTQKPWLFAHDWATERGHRRASVSVNLTSILDDLYSRCGRGIYMMSS